MSNRQNREKAIVQLYNEGKSNREISKIARISIRDIKPILQKYGADICLSNIRETDIYFGNEEVNCLPNLTKAYKLFSKGKKPLQSFSIIPSTVL